MPMRRLKRPKTKSFLNLPHRRRLPRFQSLPHKAINTLSGFASFGSL